MPSKTVWCLLHLLTVTLGKSFVEQTGVDKRYDIGNPVSEEWRSSTRTLAHDSMRKIRSKWHAVDPTGAASMDPLLPSPATVVKVAIFEPPDAIGTTAGDAATLLTLKTLWEGSGSLLQSWNSSAVPSLCSSWLGVTCTANGRVASLSIHGSDSTLISGTLPDSIANLSALSTLSLTNLLLSGPLPAGIQHLAQLQVLNVSGNNFNGSLPYLGGPPLMSIDLKRNAFSFDFDAEFRQLTGLENRVRILDFSSNLIGGRIPDGIGSFRLLEALDLSQNRLSGPIPATIGNLTVLRHLDVHSNKLNGSLPSSIGQLAALAYVDVSVNDLDGPLPLELGNCLELSVLMASNNSLSGSIPSELGDCQQLSVLDLSYNALSGNLPESLTNCQNLVTLILDLNNISGSIPPKYSSELALQHFSMSRNQLSGGIPTNLTGWQRGRMSYLLLSYNNLSGTIPEVIGSLDSLVLVGLQFNKLSGNLPASLTNCRQLAELALFNNRLSGPLWPNFGSFLSLQNLYLQENELTGDIPGSFVECSTLNKVNMTNNGLTGSIPEAIDRLANLYTFAVAGNQLSGSIPPSIGNLSHVISLRLNGNRLSGSIPQLSNLLALETFYLHSNELSGNLPEGLIQSLRFLQRLDVSNNHLSGQIPVNGWQSLAPSLTRLGLSGNEFSGGIPTEFQHLNSLTVFNVSHNRLSGHVPGGAMLNFSASSFQGNDGLCGPPLPGCHGHFSVGAISGLAVAGFVLLAAILGLVFLIWAWKRKQEGTLILFQDIGVKINISDIRKATDNFSDGFKLGSGFQGMVYKAVLSEERTIAVKRLHGKGSMKASIAAEVRSMAKLKHRHLASIVGCFVGPQDMLIMYEYVPGGDLHQFLHGRRQSRLVTWRTSYELCLGIARGLKYLHHGSAEPLVHRDIKPANILIGPDNTAQITDFGLSRFFDEGSTHLSTKMAGSVGYVAPECCEGRANSKSDVYSFGVLLLEILTGYSPRSDALDDFESMAEWAAGHGMEAGVKFQSLKRNSLEANEFRGVLSLACLCCSRKPENRPDMISVVKKLEEVRGAQVSFGGSDEELS